jgi:metal-sulfur cluster biosynthetic enzyme
MTTKDIVMKTLKKVVDPELGLGLVDLGLIYGVKINDAEVSIDLTLTSPGCPIASEIMGDIEKVLLKLKGVSKVDVNLVFDPPWTPEKMSAEARAELGF